MAQGQRHACMAASAPFVAAAAMLVLTAALALLPQQTHAHGLMVWPPSRNWLSYTKEHNNWSDGLNAGGVTSLSRNGALKWPQATRGLCGDAYNRNVWDKPRSVAMTYAPGQTITVDTVVSVNHLGRISMQVCSLDAKSTEMTKKCKPLVRADPAGNGKNNWYFPFIDKWTGGNKGDAKPRYGDNSYAYYPHPGVSSQADGCTSQGVCLQFKGMMTYRTWWQLPSGFKCDHCKLEWHWMTAHRCWPPCPKENSNEPTCKNTQIYPYCGTNGAAYPESFYNCADISIRDNARAPSVPAWAQNVKVIGGTWGNKSPQKMYGR